MMVYGKASYICLPNFLGFQYKSLVEFKELINTILDLKCLYVAVITNRLFQKITLHFIVIIKILLYYKNDLKPANQLLYYNLRISLLLSNSQN